MCVCLWVWVWVCIHVQLYGCKSVRVCVCVYLYCVSLTDARMCSHVCLHTDLSSCMCELHTCTHPILNQLATWYHMGPFAYAILYVQ